jgi:hypothetical protein
MPARNRNPIQLSRVSLACLALLVAVCGGYFALVPFLKAIEPSPAIGADAKVQRASVTVRVVNGVDPSRKPTLVTNQLKPKRHKTVKPKKPAKKPATKKRSTTTVPTRPVLVTNPVRPRSTTSTPSRSHTTTTPTRTHSAPTRTTPKKPAAPTPSRNRPPIVRITSQQGSGLAGRGSGSGATVSGGVSSTPGH